MSAFLAPIHTWLFKKILLAEELEKSLIEVVFFNAITLRIFSIFLALFAFFVP